MFRLTWDPWECARNRNVKESLQMEREKELSDPNGACGHDNHGGGAVLITLKQEFDVSPEGPEPRDKRPASKAKLGVGPRASWRHHCLKRLHT